MAPIITLCVEERCSVGRLEPIPAPVGTIGKGHRPVLACVDEACQFVRDPEKASRACCLCGGSARPPERFPQTARANELPQKVVHHGIRCVSPFGVAQERKQATTRFRRISATRELVRNRPLRLLTKLRRLD